MAENSDGNAAQLASQQPPRHETALVLSTQAGSDIAMTKLAFVTADLARKREGLEQSINKAKTLEEALEKNAAERQQLMAEVDGLTDNDYNDIDHIDPKVAGLEEKVAMLEAQVAQFKAKERDMAIACAHASENVSHAANNDDDIDHTDPKVAILEEKVAMLEAQVAQFQAKEREMAIASAHASENVSHAANNNGDDDDGPEPAATTQQTSSFLLANSVWDGPAPDGTLHMLQLMAAVKSPEQLHGMGNFRIFNILPPLIPGVRQPRIRQPRIVPQTEFEMLMEVYVLLSGNLEQDDVLLSSVMLLPRLASMQPASEFPYILGTFEHLHEIVNEAPVKGGILLALLQFALLQLKAAGYARFRPLGTHSAIPALSKLWFSSTMSKFTEVIFNSRMGDTSEELAVKLAGACRKHPASISRYGFHDETTRNRGWFTQNIDDIVLVIDFEESSLLVVHGKLCTVEKASLLLNLYTLRIRGPCKGDQDKLIENLSQDLYIWLKQWVLSGQSRSRV